MAKLWLARSRSFDVFDKVVVVKEVLPQLAADSTFVALFLDEARVSAKLHHPNVVHVFDAGADAGSYFLAMEYVHGHDVHALIQRARRDGRPLPIGVAVAISRAMCAGLHHAHELAADDGSPLAVVHRDVSPSNVLVSYDGHVKVTDFGIARIRRSAPRTLDGHLRGKLPYMSPEQIAGGVIDRRSDVYAIGLVLYELLTQVRAHEHDGDSDFDVMRRVREVEPVRLSTLRPDCQGELDRIVGKAIAKDPARRYLSAQALQVDLETFARDTRLASSDLEVASVMAMSFAVELEAWNVARARGASVLEHVTATRTTTTAEVLPRRRRLAPALAFGAVVAAIVVVGTAWPGADPPRRPDVTESATVPAPAPPIELDGAARDEAGVPPPAIALPSAMHSDEGPSPVRPRRSSKRPPAEPPPSPPADTAPRWDPESARLPAP